MKKKVIDILINQLDDYCHKTNCKHCAYFIFKQYCLSSALQHYQNNPAGLMKYLYSLDEGGEMFYD